MNHPEPRVLLLNAVIYQQVLNFEVRTHEGGTDVPKDVGVVKDHAFECVCNLCINLVL
jgi:hypothetical protein